MKHDEDAQTPANEIRTLTEFTPLGIATALAAIARRSSRPVASPQESVDPYAGPCWCPCGAG